MEDSNTVFDQVLAQIGDYGKFQKRFCFVFLFLFAWIGPIPYMTLIMSLAVPDHWCHVPGRNNTNYTLDEWKDLHIPRESDSWGKSKHISCKMYNTSNQDMSNSIERGQIACLYGYEYDQTWFISTVPSSQDWVCDKSLYISNALAVSTVGDVCGSFILGQLGDYIGRRPIYLIGIIITLVGRFSGIFASHSYYLFLGIAFLGSFPSVTAIQSALVISMETTKPQKRAFLAQVQNYGFCLSMITLSLISWAIPHWKIYTLIGVIPSIFFIFTYGFVVESPRWLAGRGRLEDSVKQLHKIAKVNGTQLEPEMIEKLRKAAKKPEVVYGIMSTLSSWRLAKNTIIMNYTLIVFGLCHSTIYMNTTNLGGNPFVQFLWQSIVEVPGYTLGKYLCNRIGRRYTGSMGYFFAVLMFIPTIITIGDKNAVVITNSFMLLAKFFLSITFYTQTLQTLEIYPTCLRQTGLSLALVLSGVFIVVVPYIIYLGTAFDARYPYMMMSGISSTAAVLQLFLPETLYAQLPETLEEAREFGKFQKFFSWPRKGSVKVASMEEAVFIQK